MAKRRQKTQETYQVVLLHLISELLELARKGENLDWPAIEEEARAIQDDLAARVIAGQPLTAELRENILKRLRRDIQVAMRDDTWLRIMALIRTPSASEQRTAQGPR